MKKLFIFTLFLLLFAGAKTRESKPKSLQKIDLDIDSLNLAVHKLEKATCKLNALIK